MTGRSPAIPRVNTERGFAAQQLTGGRLLHGWLDRCRTEGDGKSRMLTNTARDPFQVLQTVGSFAVYREECGDARTGAALLQAALERVNWDAVTVKLKSEARVTYEGLLARMQRAE